VKDWCKRHAGWLAIGFAIVAIVLLGVAAFQAWMLHSQGWLIALGTLPDWVTAAFTGVAAIGVLAAFGSLRIVRGEWKSQQDERRDQQANQARLIIVEAVPRAEMVPPANEAPVRPDGKPEYRYVVIRNRSQEPVFNVRIPDGSHVETKEAMPWVTSVGEVRAQQEDGSLFSPTPTIVHRHTPELVPVLAPGQATFQLHLATVPRDEQVTEYVFFTFTDARGIPWSRFGSQQPVQHID
jgi:membrane protein implicated in regulation of membrane protease activity